MTDAFILAIAILPLLYFFMYRRFSESVKGLKKLSAALEQRVLERTAQLEFSEAVHRLVLASSSDAILRTSADGEILMANPAAYWMFGYTKAELERGNISLFLPGGFEKVLVDGYARTLDGWNGHHSAPFVQAEAVTKSGKKLVVECSASECLVNSEVSFVIVMRDATERKKAEEEKNISEERLLTLIHAMTDVVYFKDGEGRWLVVNESGLKLFGLENINYRGKRDSELLPPTDFHYPALCYCEQTDKKAWEADGPTRVMEKIPRPDGSLRQFDVIKVPLYHENGERRGLVIFGRDVTDRVKWEEELKSAKEAAESATRLKDKFISLVAHDLKSPLGTMIGFIGLAGGETGTQPNDATKRLLDMAMESGTRMVGLIDELLKISRFQTGQLKLERRFFDAKSLGDKMMADYSNFARQKGVGMENAIPENSRVYGDIVLLTEAIQNLVTNAIKFCKSGDRITIFSPEKGSTTICVKDSGPGMKPEVLDKVFKFEEKTSTPGTDGEVGTGFGLPLVKNIMEFHGGTIHASCEPGEGCVFSMELPNVRPVILLVDDDRNFRLLQIQQLKDVDANVMEAENGVAALDMISTRRPHLVIADVKMPIMDGLELLKRLKGGADTKDIPVIIISGEYDMESRDKVFKMGADDFVTKNMDPVDFIPRVRRFVG
ncbi:MAG: PAS domain S-box protein [Nitrospinae bacterium]|nr:PAS domain S-box protein [Nitrospinota bacterium]